MSGVPAAIAVLVAAVAAGTRLLVTEPRTRRLVLSAVVVPGGGRLFVARRCRPAGEARVSP